MLICKKGLSTWTTNTNTNSNEINMCTNINKAINKMKGGKR